MYPASIFLALLAIGLPSQAAPTKSIEPRGASQCAQYSSISTGIYTIYANGWGWQYGTGSECSQINSYTGTTLGWQTSWSWANGPYNVKAYTNVEASLTSKPLSQYKSIMTTWSWSYTGTNIVANVAYDTFLGTSATGANAYEVMVWLGDFGGCSPLSNDGYPPVPEASPTIGGVAWNLIIGQNGNVVVYSFVAQNKAATSFSGNLLLFYQYLITNYQLSSSQYLQSIQAGSEVFTGSNCVLTTSAYNIAVQ